MMRKRKRKRKEQAGRELRPWRKGGEEKTWKLERKKTVVTDDDEEEEERVG